MLQRGIDLDFNGKLNTFPSADIVDLYAHRWEIELSFREMKQLLLVNRFTLRSNQPEFVK